MPRGMVLANFCYHYGIPHDWMWTQPLCSANKPYLDHSPLVPPLTSGLSLSLPVVHLRGVNNK